MDQPQATLITGIATACASTAIGLGAIVFSWLNTRTTLKNQREMAQEERLADMRKQFVEEIANWLASEVGIVGQVYLDKSGSRKHALKNPSDHLIGRALIFDATVSEALKRMRLSYLREDSVVKSQNPDDYWEKSLPAEREAWRKAYEALLAWLHDQYGTSNSSSTK